MKIKVYSWNIYNKHNDTLNKFNHITGEYTKKYSNLELSHLPGYTDRILYKNIIYAMGTYKSHHLLGSDHIPISISLYD